MDVFKVRKSMPFVFITMLIDFVSNPSKLPSLLPSAARGSRANKNSLKIASKQLSV